jgi:hypothetical protein
MLSTTTFTDRTSSLHSALRSATSVPLSGDFDDCVVAALRKANWIETLNSHLRIFTPAMVCGMFLMTTVMHVAFNMPDPGSQALDSAPTQTVNVAKLMYLIDKQGQCVASAALMRESMEDIRIVLPSSFKVDPHYHASSSLTTLPNLV